MSLHYRMRVAWRDVSGKSGRFIVLSVAACGAEQSLIGTIPPPGIKNMPIGISPLVDFAFKLMLAS